ncbi:MAG: hypothetical protein ACRDRH_22990 [Pseudonocardia sp.]
MTLVLDTGAFVAVERGNRRLAAEIKREWLAGRPAVTHGGVIGQVWRGGSGRQFNLARTIEFVNVAALGAELGKQAGALLALAGGNDVVDAAVVRLARDDDLVLTSDPDDLLVLAAASGVRMEIIVV